MADELEPCPFCGNDTVHVHDNYVGGSGFMVMCGSCTAEGPLCNTEGAAASEWNRRAAPIAAQLDQDAERAAFERVYAELNHSTPGGGWNDFDSAAGRYHEEETHDAWVFWQAARRAAPVAAQLDATEQPKSAFLTHLAESGKAVEGWPEWKTGLWNSDRAAQLDAELPPLESIAKAMAEHSGWEQWDTATNFCHTPGGNEPEEEREYWRELAKLAVAPYAERIRLLERAAGNTIGIGSRVYTAEQIDGRIRELMHDLDVADKLVANAGREIEAARIDGRTAGTASDAAPDGYVLVPKKITPAMIKAAMESHYGKKRVAQVGGAGGVSMTVNGTDYNGTQAMRRFWAGALAAAPPPQENTNERH